MQKLAQDLVEETKIARMKRIRDFQTAALDRYRQAQEGLLKLQEIKELGPAESATLRNSCFAVAGLLLDLGQYEDAVKAYTLAANRYQHLPVGLDAYVEMARAYRHLNRKDEARGTMAQAKLVLSRLPAQVRCEATTNHTRQQWADLLDEMGRM